MPHVWVDLLLEDDETNLLLREAEIAVRLYRPQQLDLVAKCLGSTYFGFYASQGFIDEFGAPSTIQDLREFPLIGFDRRATWIEHAKSMGYDFDRNDFRVRTDAGSIHPALTQAGAGISVLPTWVGDRLGLTRVCASETMPGQPVFLTACTELRKNPRVARVWDHLSEALVERVVSPPNVASTG